MSHLALAMHVALAFGLTVTLAFALLPLFRRYALARPNARSSHRAPVPQGGGIAFILVPVALWLDMGMPGAAQGKVLIPAILAIGLLGAIDDLKPLGWRLRLVVHAACVLLLLASLPAEARLIPAMPGMLEGVLALLLGVWFVNLVNFMDGIDGILVVGLAPLFAAIGTGFGGLIAPEPFAALLAAGLAGFLVLNRPQARLFAGDVGALAIGLAAAAFLHALALQAGLVPAILLPLYFVMDATLTLLIRLNRRAVLTEAHREHAYQRAFDAGLPVWRIIGAILALNLLLVLLAAMAIQRPGFAMFALLLGVGATALLIRAFRRVGRG